jgi:hypothetical protein
MPNVDTDYSAYVNATYLIALGALAAALVWSVFRMVRARRKLDEAENPTSDAHGDAEP